MSVALRVQLLGILVCCCTLSAMEDGEVEQTSLLCSVPREIVLAICDCLGQWQDVNALGATCKHLDKIVTLQHTGVRINCFKKRLEGQTSAHFLAMVDHLVSRIVARQGNNQIALTLSCNRLGDDMEALKNFFINCSHQDRVDYIHSLELDYDELESLPNECAGLSKLRFLSLETNPLESDALNCIVKLAELESLCLDDNLLTTLPVQMSSMQKLEQVDVSANALSDESLAILGAIPNLEELKISYNTKITLVALVHAVVQWKNIKEVHANRISASAEDVSLLDTVPRHIKFYC